MSLIGGDNAPWLAKCDSYGPCRTHQRNPLPSVTQQQYAASIAAAACPIIPSAMPPTYALDGSKPALTFNACDSGYGYAAAAAALHWHGRFGFNCVEGPVGGTVQNDVMQLCVSVDENGYTFTVPGQLSQPSGLPFTQAHLSAPRNRYLCVNATATTEQVGDGAFNYTRKIQFKVARNGDNGLPYGCRVLDTWTDSDPGASSTVKARLAAIILQTDSTLDLGWTLTDDWPISITKGGKDNGVLLTGDVSAGLNITATKKIPAFYGGPPGYDWNGTTPSPDGGLLQEVWTVTLSPLATFQRTKYVIYSIGGVDTALVSTDEYCSLGETHLEWSKKTYTYSGAGVQVSLQTDSLVADLSDENSDSSVISNANILLAMWNLRDRVQMPLTVGGWTGQCPLVSLLDILTNAAPMLGTTFPGGNIAQMGVILGTSTVGDYRTWDGSKYGDLGYVDDQCYSWKKSDGTCVSGWTGFSGGTTAAALVQSINGETMGGPNQYCPNGIPETFPNVFARANPFAFGTTIGEAANPPLATQYYIPGTTPFNPIPIGRMARYDGQYFVLTKWAETPMRLPSVDHGRPYGADRGQPNWNPALYTCDDELNLLPSPKPLRWALCPPFGGRLAITSIADNHDGTATVTHAEMPVLNKVMPDGSSPSVKAYALDFCDAAMTVLSANQMPSVTPTSTSSFTIASSLLATVVNAKWLTLYGSMPGEAAVNWLSSDSNGNQPGSHSGDPGQYPTGSPLDYIPTSLPVAKWYWCDNKGKGNYIKFVYLGQLRQNGERERLSPYLECDGVTTVPLPDETAAWGASAVDECKLWNGCATDLIVISGNASDNPTYDFPSGLASLSLDQLYPETYFVWVEQAMLDPFYQPALTCSVSGPVTDPASCIQFVECRAILPAKTGLTYQPDNGAGAGQNEGPPAGRPDYTIILPAYPTPTGTVYQPPAAGDNPIHTFLPTPLPDGDGQGYYCPP